MKKLLLTALCVLLVALPIVAQGAQETPAVQKDAKVYTMKLGHASTTESTKAQGFA